MKEFKKKPISIHARGTLPLVTRIWEGRTHWGTWRKIGDAWTGVRKEKKDVHQSQPLKSKRKKKNRKIIILIGARHYLKIEHGRA